MRTTSLSLLLLAACFDEESAFWNRDPADEGQGDTATGEHDTGMHEDSSASTCGIKDEPLATVAWVIEADPDAGMFGVEVYPYDYNTNTWDSDRILCHSDTAYIPTTPYIACKTCDFAYSYVGTAEGERFGNYCEQFGAAAGDEGYSIGVGAVSDYNGYGIAAVYLYLAGYPDYQWFLFTFDDGPIYHALIDGDTVSGSRIRVDRNTGYPVYYGYIP